MQLTKIRNFYKTKGISMPRGINNKILSQRESFPLQNLCQVTFQILFQIRPCFILLYVPKNLFSFNLKDPFEEKKRKIFLSY